MEVVGLAGLHGLVAVRLVMVDPDQGPEVVLVGQHVKEVMSWWSNATLKPVQVCNIFLLIKYCKITLLC